MNTNSSIIYTIEKAVCKIDQKKTKGKLTIYSDGYFFSGKSSLSEKFDICAVTVSKSSLGTHGLLGEKHKPALCISIPGKKDGIFAINEKNLDDVINAVKKAAQKEENQRKENRYSLACQKMRQITKSSEAADVGEEFIKLSGYKDSKKKAEECKIFELDYKKKEEAYASVSLFFDSDDLNKVHMAITILEELQDYLDAPQKLINALHKRNTLVEKTYTDACYILSNARSASAVNLALLMFQEIPEYKDSGSKIIECNTLKQEFEQKESIFIQAQELLKNASTVEHVEEARKLFLSIEGYRAADEQVQSCEVKKNVILKRIYNDALHKLSIAKVPSDVNEPIALLKSIEGYSDAQQQIARCLEVQQTLEKKEAIYKKAKDDLNVANAITDYETIRNVLLPIAGYCDAKEIISKCNSQIKAIKEAEERAQKEAEEKARLEAEKKAKIAAIESAQSAPDDFSITEGKISTTNRKALNLFLDNPFRILGISRNATQEDAQGVLDKFKKLERLKALSSYSAPYHLKHFIKPDRSAAVIQAAIGTLNDISNRILWFATPVGCAAWVSTEYRLQTRKLSSIDYDKYDIFLANYVFAILNDPLFETKSLWDKVFKRMVDYIKDVEKTKQLFTVPDDKKTEAESDFASLFEKKISQPILFMIEDADIIGLKNLYVLIKEKKDLKTLTRKLDGRLSNWFETETRAIDKEISELGEGERATPSLVSKAKQLYADLKKTVRPELTWAEDNYPAKSVRLTMFQDEYRGTAWSLMGFLFQAGSKAEARGIANDIEKYCTDEQKDILKYVIREVPRPRPKPVPPQHEHYILSESPTIDLQRFGGSLFMRPSHVFA